jgi:TonB family protein
MRRTLALVVAVATWGALTSRVSASEELDRAKDLYRAASYDEALSLLEGLPAATGTTEVAQAREYRVLCLVALDRRDDARRVMGDLIAADPTYAMSETEASPRVRTMFTEVRRGLLPSIVQHAYAEAKLMFDRRDPQAVAAFDRVLTLLRDPDVAGNASLGDLATLSAGFRDLSQALVAAAAPPPPTPAPPVVSAPRPPVAPGPIIAPVAISQVVPTPQIREEREWDGEIEVTIDADGKVTAARMTKPIHPVYDQQLIRAAASWTFRPAQRDGAAIGIVKTITIHVDTRPECSLRGPQNCRDAAKVR